MLPPWASAICAWQGKAAAPSLAMRAISTGINAAAMPCNGRVSISKKAISLRVITKKCLKTMIYVMSACAVLGYAGSWMLPRIEGSREFEYR